METFLISSDDCLILKAFKDAKSLREAAVLLNCDPAGLARRVQLISNKHGFLHKVNNRWCLSSRGLQLVAWTEDSIQSQKKALKAKNTLRIASTMWLSQQVLVPTANRLLETLEKDIEVNLSVPFKNYELALLDGTVDFVVVCHPPENPEIEHRPICAEEWNVIIPARWKRHFLNTENMLKKLGEFPLVHHSEMNLDLFLPTSEHRESSLSVDNLIGIRAAVEAEQGWSIVPKLLIKTMDPAKIFCLNVDLKVTDRKVCVWWLRQRYDIKRLAPKICNWVKNECTTLEK